MRSLQDRVAVVTGGGSGIGRATAELLTRRGCHVALVDVSEAGLEETRRLLAPSGRNVTSHVADVSSWERVEALPAEVLEAHGACHVVVNNAGVTSAGAFLEESDVAAAVGRRQGDRAGDRAQPGARGRGPGRPGAGRAVARGAGSHGTRGSRAAPRRSTRAA